MRYWPAVLLWGLLPPASQRAAATAGPLRKSASPCYKSAGESGCSPPTGLLCCELHGQRLLCWWHPQSLPPPLQPFHLTSHQQSWFRSEQQTHLGFLLHQHPGCGHPHPGSGRHTALHTLRLCNATPLPLLCLQQQQLNAAGHCPAGLTTTTAQKQTALRLNI